MKKEAKMSNSNANIGWLFSKDYYHGLHNGMSSDVQKKNETKTVVVANCLAPQNDDEEQAIKKFFDDKNGNIIDCNINLANNTSLNCSSFVLETIYPGLLIGTGNIHETGMLGECKLGLQFDYTTGLPYIPGSSVKGLLRSMFPFSIPKKNNENGRWDRYRKQRVEYITEFFKSNSIDLTEDDVYSLEKILFDGIDRNGDNVCMYNRCVFYDAMISMYNEESGILGNDFITPHKDPLKNPNPIQFMKVMPKVQFKFQFRIPNEINLKSGVPLSQEPILNLFKTILMDVGVGAKTNVGYGQLIEARKLKKKAPSANNIVSEDVIEVKGNAFLASGEELFKSNEKFNGNNIKIINSDSFVKKLKKKRFINDVTAKVTVQNGKPTFAVIEMN